MGYASYLIWKDGGGFSGDAQLPLALYASQLALNWAWTPIFFRAHNFKLVSSHPKSLNISSNIDVYIIIFVQAFYEMLLMAGNIGACIYTFSPINQTAAYLLVPYLAWVSFATALTYKIWCDNPAKKAD